jgi:hypothetical protein
VELHTQVEDIQTLSYPHASGEVFVANNLEEARQRCHVLGKMSLAEAGLLFELVARGKEQIAEQPDQAREKPVIEKIEKVQPNPNQASKAAKPVKEAAVNATERLAKESPLKMAESPVEVTAKRAVSKPAELELHEVAMQQAEAARIASTSKRERTEETKVSDIAAVVPAEKKQSATTAKEVHPEPETEIIEAARFRDEQQKVQEVAITRENINHPSSESSLEQPVEMYVTDTPTLVETKTPIINEELTQAEGPAAESLLTEAVEETTSADMAVLAGEETIEADESDIPVDQFETDEVITIPGIIEQSSLENNDEGAFSAANDISRPGEDAPVEFLQAEPRPIIEIQELSSPLVEIEATVTKLVEAVELEDAEKPKKVDAILEEIITLPAKLEVAAAEEVEQLEEKLEELFVELFEEAGISYSPELVGSFVKLTKAHYLEELLAITKDAGETQDLPAEIGTREFLQKLKHVLSAMKQAAINFDEIGKSIMRLYTYSF